MNTNNPCPEDIYPIEGAAQDELALFTDLYELTMLQAYFNEEMLDDAVFSLFVRRLPDRRNFLLACGLDTVLSYLENLHFNDENIGYLRSLGKFSERFLSWLSDLRFAREKSGPSPKAHLCLPTSRFWKSSHPCRRRN